MSRTNIDIDDDLVAAVMSRFNLPTKKEAVNFALRAVRDEALTVEEILALRGTGFWDGDPVTAGLEIESTAPTA